MHDNPSHPLLEQVPLTVSPFVHLPRATTLPYRYKQMPSALPPSIIDGGPNGTASGRTPYVVSPSSSSAAHPDDIIASCRALREHLARLQTDADRELHQLEERIRERDLAEKRRVAPGWLDTEERLLVPERQDGQDQSSDLAQSSHGHTPSQDSTDGRSEMAAGNIMPALGNDPGAELDRAFGVMQLNK